MDAIAEAAAAARPGWEAIGPAGRAAALRAVADALDAHAGELVALADRETALGSTRLTGEVARTTGQLRLFADVLADGGYLDMIIEPARPGRARPAPDNRPLGPVAVFAASNFPFAFSVAGGDTASALAAGCPVVVKAHEGHPHTSVRDRQLVTAALAGAGAPDGTFAVVFGVARRGAAGPAPGDHRRRLHRVRPGRPRAARSAPSGPCPIPFYGELGSVNPVVVLPGAAAAAPPRSPPATPARSPSAPGSSAPTPGCCSSPTTRACARPSPSAVQATAGAPDAGRADPRRPTTRPPPALAGAPGGHPAGHRAARRGPVGGHPAGVPDQPGRLRGRAAGPWPRSGSARPAWWSPTRRWTHLLPVLAASAAT